ncbi:MAG: cupredoxin domain-containing protein [Candidatus Pacearchaeota archaeon]
MAKNNALLAFGIVLLFVVGAYFVFSSLGPSNSRAILNEDGTIIEGDLQKVTLSIKDLNYYPSKITVQAGKPVELTLDSSVTGCFRAFTVRELGLVKYSKKPSEKIIFTPTKPGSYTFACSMGMGFGTLEVK